MKTIYIIPFPGEDGVSRFYDLSSQRDEVARPFIYLREGIEQAGFTFKLAKPWEELSEAAAVLNFTNFHEAYFEPLLKVPREKRLYLSMEPVIVCPESFHPELSRYFRVIFTLFDDQVDNLNYFKIHHIQAYEARVEDIPDFVDKRFCTMIQTRHTPPKHPQEIYSEREKVAVEFPQLGDFDLYGHGWQGHASWKGHVFNKKAILKNYKFCIAYENMKEQRGYITDRIFDCFYNGTVPVYWGAPDIEDTVPKECFVDRRLFDNNRDLHRFLSAMDPETYLSYLAAGEAYLHSEKAKLFTPRAFSETILNKIYSF